MSEAFVFGPFRLLVARRELLAHGVPVTMGQRAFEILQQGGPVELRERDLDDQTMEHATAASETPVIVRIGKVLIGQQH